MNGGCFSPPPWAWPHSFWNGVYCHQTAGLPDSGIQGLWVCSDRFQPAPSRLAKHVVMPVLQLSSGWRSYFQGASQSDCFAMRHCQDPQSLFGEWNLVSVCVGVHMWVCACVCSSWKAKKDFSNLWVIEWCNVLSFDLVLGNDGRCIKEMIDGQSLDQDSPKGRQPDRFILIPRKHVLSFKIQSILVCLITNTRKCFIFKMQALPLKGALALTAAQQIKLVSALQPDTKAHSNLVLFT